jgi:hypothetical protein
MPCAIHPHGANVLALINNEDSFYRVPGCALSVVALIFYASRTPACNLWRINALLGRCKLI